jgi:hypothetical protein
MMGHLAILLTTLLLATLGSLRAADVLGVLGDTPTFEQFD